MASIQSHVTGALVQLDAAEAEILRHLFGEMKELLDNEAAIQDDVIDRLFPRAYAEADDADAFSELVGQELKDGKLGAIAAVLSLLGGGGPVETELPRSEIDRWLTALTDLRLALGTRLEVTEEKMSAELDPADPQAGGMALLHWLGWMQEMFINAITEVSDDGRT
ncbi:MAG: hypothetical protein QOG16_1230 [Actinomycetota bacterium]|jgi:hypothetical protein|nr:hypothetical protein [Actinomycetota bacterium]